MVSKKKLYSIGITPCRPGCRAYDEGSRFFYSFGQNFGGSEHSSGPARGLAEAMRKLQEMIDKHRVPHYDGILGRELKHSELMSRKNTAFRLPFGIAEKFIFEGGIQPGRTEGKKSAELGPFPEPEGPKNRKNLQVCVKVRFSESEFIEVVKDAEEAGCRLKGPKPFRQKPHGFAWERVANTKGISKFLKKKAIPSWREGKQAREEAEARLQVEAAKLGRKVI